LTAAEATLPYISITTCTERQWFRASC